MEALSEEFRDAVISLLDGEIPVIAAVKYKEIPFLEMVRSHPKAKCFYITKENREELYREIVEYMKGEASLWNEKR